MNFSKRRETDVGRYYRLLTVDIILSLPFFRFTSLNSRQNWAERSALMTPIAFCRKKHFFKKCLKNEVLSLPAGFYLKSLSLIGRNCIENYLTVAYKIDIPITYNDV